MNAIEIKGLTKKFKDFTLDGIDFILPSGCITGLIGENGAGKSTMISLILGLLKKDGGSVTVLGESDISGNMRIMEDIGVALDSAMGIPQTMKVRQIEKLMSKIYRNWDGKVFTSYTNKLKINTSTEFYKLSRGTRMKLMIAIALSHNAKLLILDEATNGLDPVVRDEVLNILIEFTRDETHSVLISSHIVSDLEKICDYVAFLHEGKLVLYGEKDVLRESYGIIRCTDETSGKINDEAIIGKKTSPYGNELIVRRDCIPAGTEVSPVGIEELFVFMINEEAKNEGTAV